ncbi:hypothetical protein Tco_1407854, partial [Tanacetum coccineum]
MAATIAIPTTPLPLSSSSSSRHHHCHNQHHHRRTPPHLTTTSTQPPPGVRVVLNHPNRGAFDFFSPAEGALGFHSTIKGAFGCCFSRHRVRFGLLLKANRGAWVGRAPRKGALGFATAARVHVVLLTTTRGCVGCVNAKGCVGLAVSPNR